MPTVTTTVTSACATGVTTTVTTTEATPDQIVPVVFTGPQYTLYSNLICPFAMRAHVAALEKAVPFTYEKVPLSVEINKDPSLSKSKFFLEEINPAGTVPAISYQGESVNESDVCAFFLEGAYPDQGASLRPRNPLLSAKMYTANKLFNPGPCYGFLKNQDPASDADFVEKYEAMLKKWVEAHGDGGPFVCGEQYTLADIMASPFINRFKDTLLHYRGYNVWSGPEPWRIQLKAWYDACEARPAFAEVAQTPEFYIEWYAGYAGDRGQSTLGN